MSFLSRLRNHYKVWRLPMWRKTRWEAFRAAFKVARAR